MTIETLMYGKPRPYSPKAEPCGLSTVDVQAKILINETVHAGIVTHVCAKPKGHWELECRCACGQRWVRNVK